MACIILADICLGCGACMALCPPDAIEEVDSLCVIDPDKCIECGACQQNCPVEAAIED